MKPRWTRKITAAVLVALAGPWAGCSGDPSGTLSDLGILKPGGQTGTAGDTSAAATADTTEPAWRPDGPVHAIATSGPITWVGGEFSAPPRLARLDTAGRPDPGFTQALGTGFNGAVRAILLLEDGGTLVGGDFTGFNGQPVGRLARLSASGALDAGFQVRVGSGADDSVLALARRPDGSFAVAGRFRGFGGLEAARFVLLTPDGAPVPAPSPAASVEPTPDPSVEPSPEPTPDPSASPSDVPGKGKGKDKGKGHSK